MAKIENQRFSIQDAFQQCFYRIPDYQREYVWTEKEVYQLLEDLNEGTDDSSDIEYFIGTILVSPTEIRDHFEVIDGQQRLTTFFLILCALRNRFEKDQQATIIKDLLSSSYTNNMGDIVSTFKLSLLYENADEIIKRLIDGNSEPENVRKKIEATSIPFAGSIENLWNAYEVIYKYLLDNYSQKDQLKRYWGYLANSVVFIQISTDVNSALKIFETINERGVGLNPMDLLKNLLFTHVEKDDFTKLKNEWKKITEPLERKREKPLRFLRYYIMSNYSVKNKRSDGIVREDEIYTWFTDKQNAEECSYKTAPFEFVRNVGQNVNSYIGFINRKGNDSEDSNAMKDLAYLCGSAFSLHYILLLAAKNLPLSLFNHFATQLENFLFYYIFTKTPTKELERLFSSWADELRAISKEESEKQIDRYNEFLREKFQKNVLLKKEELFDFLKRYSLNSMQKYRTRYLLAKLTQYVDAEYKGAKDALETFLNLEIEHILPNNPEQELRDSFFRENPDVDYDTYKNRLGNLTLFEKPLNIIAGNGFFEQKTHEYKKSKNYLTSSIVEIVTSGKNSSINRIGQKLQSYDCWDAKAIDDRQDTLIKLIDDVWRVEEYEKA